MAFRIRAAVAGNGESANGLCAGLAVLPRGAAEREISRIRENVGATALAENETEKSESICRVTSVRRYDVC